MLFFRQHKKLSKVITGLVLFSLVVSLVSPVLLYPKKAQAIPVVAPITDTLKATWEVLKKLWEQLEEAYNAANFITWQTALTNFLSRIAYDAAVAIGSGDKGQQEQFFSQDWGDYLEDQADMVAGDYIDSLGKSIGVDLCVPPTIGLEIALGLGKRMKPDKPKCSLMKMKENWETSLEDPNFLQKFSASFKPEETEIGTWFKASAKMDTEIAKEQIEATKKRESSYLKDTEEKVSKQVTTPAGLKEEELEKTMTDTDAAQKTPPPENVGILGTVATVFVNTLLAELTKKILKDAMWSLKGLGKDRSASLNLPTASGRGGRAAAEQAFASLLTPRIKGGGEYDILQEFTVCPFDRKAVGLYNCVIDNNFAQAIRGKGEGEYYSIKEAIGRDVAADRGTGKSFLFLNPNLPFGWKDAQARPAQEPNFGEGYSYSSMMKLRRFRIIPLGWEIAAQKIADPKWVDYQNYTLQEVLDCFEDNPKCKAKGENPDTPVGAGNHNYLYHLVDPDWLLKAPKQSCEAMTYGQILEYGSNQRKQYCTNSRDCVVEADDGSCLAWDYCTREKNIWRFGGDQCSEIYNTCRTYHRTIDGAESSFLKNTLSGQNICNAQNAGCQWYSKSKTGGAWNENDRIYLNRQAKECDADNDGCREFLRVRDDKNEKLAIDKLTAAKDYVLAQTTDHNKSFADVLKTKPEYASYTTQSFHLKGNRKFCLAADVGCEKYTPADNDPWVPAIARIEPGAPLGLDECPAECVGYQNYKQEKTFFEGSKFPVYFIPKPPAKACSAAEAGCDQFTNLDAAAEGGEGIEYYTYLRRCQKPAPVNTDCATFITWVGSDTEGQQIKTWSLKKSQSHNAPCTKFNAADNTCADPDPAANEAVCAPADLATNPDCREFYDVNGNISYRLYSRTITCSDDCHPYRKTVSSETNCQNTGGSWQNNQCIYLAIPGQGKTCGAGNNGCREYKGNASNNIYRAMEYDFEATAQIPDWSPGTRVNDAIQRNGHSLKTNTNTTVSVVDKINQNSTYLLEFWAKGAGDLTIKFTSAGANDYFSDTDNNTLAPKVTLISDWRLYTLGPTFATWTPADTEKLEFSGFTSDSYLDNVVLKEVTNNIFLIKDSWATPVACATDPNLNPAIHTPPNSPGYYAGCQAYKDRDNRVYNLYKFGKLCQEDLIGCEALINTQNFISPFAKIFNPLPPLMDNVDIPADDIAYVVNDKEKYCNPTERGCQELGPLYRSYTEAQLHLSFDDTARDETGLGNNGTVYGNASWESGISGKALKFDGLDDYVKVNNSSSLDVRGSVSVEAWVKTDGLPNPNHTRRLAYPWGSSKAMPIVEKWDETKGGRYPYVLRTDQTGHAIFARYDGINSRVATSTTVVTDNHWHHLVGVYDSAAQKLQIYVDGQKEKEATDNLANDLSNGHNLGIGARINFTPYIYQGLIDEVAIHGRVLSSEKIKESYDNKKPLKTIQNRYLKNNPDQYAQILCTEAELGCETYTYEDGQAYFKDPGDKTCSYLAIAGLEEERMAWFKKENETTRVLSEADLQECREARTNEWVKTCPAEQSGCTEFIEPNDCEFRNNEWYQIGTTDKLCPRYYYLNNDKLNSRGCEGSVDWRKGCVLFNNTSNPDLIFNSKASPGPTSTTLAAPDSQCGQAGQAPCDTNLLLRVKRDRVCGEWLTCASANRVWQEGEYKDICYRVARCRGAATSGDITECKNWVPLGTGGINCQTDADCGVGGTCKLLGSEKFCSPSPILSSEIYQKRSVNWSALEYSGLSLANKFPADDLKQRSYGLDDQGNPTDFHLTYLIKATPLTTCNQDKDCITANKGNTCWNNECFEDRGIDNRGLTKISGANNAAVPCSGSSDCGWGEVCLMDIDPRNQKGSCYKTYAAGKTCRGYPEPDSPFPSFLATEWGELPSPPPNSPPYPQEVRSIIQQDADFKYANLCSRNDRDKNNAISPKEDEACQCSYKKAEYTDGQIRYYGRETVPPLNVPTPGETTTGAKKKTGEFYGWQGFCLEEDPSLVIEGQHSGKKACLTWWPIDLVQGEIDIYNNYPQAGYIADENKQYYCLRSELLEYRTGVAHEIHGCGSFWSFIGRALTAVVFAPTFLTGLAIEAASETGRAFRDFIEDPSDGKCPPGYHYTTSNCYKLGIKYGEEGYCSANVSDWHTYNGDLIYDESKIEICTHIAKIADAHQQTVAWTSRVKDIPPNPGYAVSILGYKKGQDVSPYGAVMPPSNDWPDTWPAQSGLGRLQVFSSPPDPNNPNSPKSWANSPYACSSLFCFNGHTSIRRTSDGAVPPFPMFCEPPPSTTCHPYTYVEAPAKGIERLQELFVRSFGVWEWPFKAQGKCQGKCRTGVYDARGCKINSDCWGDILIDATGDAVKDASNNLQQAGIIYTCKDDACLGGVKGGQTCAGDLDCQDPTYDDAVCLKKTEQVTDPVSGSTQAVEVYRCRKANGDELADGHPLKFDNKGKICDKDPAQGREDCRVDGICAKTQTKKACQGGVPDGRGGVMAGKGCNIDTDCLANGNCSAISCSDTTGNASCQTVADIGHDCGLGGLTKYTKNDSLDWGVKSRGITPAVTQVLLDSQGNPSEGSTGITVNNQVDKTIGFSNGTGRILVKFYAYNENGQQMPLRFINYDWGDANDETQQGSFKNHKPRCRPDSDDDYNFGDTSDACIEDRGAERPGYFFKDYVYFCPGIGSPGWTDTDTDPVKGCVFYPTVSVVDNWGKRSTVPYAGKVVICPPDHIWNANEGKCKPNP